jgi:hypothetical protein
MTKITSNQLPKQSGSFMVVVTIPTISADTQPLLLNISNTALTITSEQFDILCLNNPDLRMELTPKEN